MTESSHADLQQADLLPGAHLLDSGYVTSRTLATSQEHFGVEVIGPAPADLQWQANAEQGIDVSQFVIDWEHQQVTCPQGQRSRSWTSVADTRGNPLVKVQFSTTDCGCCPLQGHCIHSEQKYKRRTLTLRPRVQHEALQAARRQQHTTTFAQQYNLREGIEATISQGVRAFGMRRSRYIGEAKPIFSMWGLLRRSMSATSLIGWMALDPLLHGSPLSSDCSLPLKEVYQQCQIRGRVIAFAGIIRDMRKWENQMKVPKTILFTSKDMVNNRVFRREVKIGGRTITIEGLSRIGTAYAEIKKANEDGCIAFMDNTSLQVIVVDGGTQVEKAVTLDAQGITGGKYIAMKVEEFGQWLNPSANPAENLRSLNVAIGNDIAKHHPDITYTKYSRNIPYGSIAAIKIDVVNNTLEVANAGDVFAIIVDLNRIASLLTIDDVHKKDQQTFVVAKRLAKQYGVTFRYAMQERTNDQRFHEIVEEMYETLRQGNTGEIRRITGAPNFDVTALVSQKLGEIKDILLFSDGALPPGLDITTSKGLQDLTYIVDAQGLDGLNAEILKRITDDQDFEKFPRFGHIDDLTIVKVFL